MWKNKVWIFSVFFGIIISFSGCFNRVKPVEIKVYFANHTWNHFAVMDAKFEITNVDKTYEVVVGLNVIDGFEVDEVPVVIAITSPDGQQNIINKTIVVKIDGNYLGKINENVWTIEQVVYSAKQFSQTGTYSVYISNRSQYYNLYKTEALFFAVRPKK